MPNPAALRDRAVAALEQRSPRRLRPLVRPLAAGVAGTAVMTATLWAEQAARRRLSPGFTGVVDYDASPHVVQAAAAVLHRMPRTPAGRQALFLLVHWGYGSAVALGHPAAQRLAGGERRGDLAFYAACQAMALTLFPTLGGTPPPWAWRRSVLVSSFVQHAVYAGVVAAVDRPAR
ncbi:MAG: hypothetical protein ACTHMS_23170 [Jatrophihabitans sp.]|uniref:hypothetical protein n=1 Tax=Jatrophihabitans sp. TaxID=1932789 RepID=UPI003F7FBA5C